MPEIPGIQATLKHLVEAERQAGLLVASAEERAQQTLRDARLQAEQRTEAALRAADDRARVTLEQAKAEAQAHVAQQLAAMQVELERLRSGAEGGFEKAVHEVLGWVTGTEK